MIYFLYVSLIYIVAWYIYMGFYIYWDVFRFFSYDEWRRTFLATGTRFPPWRSSIRAIASRTVPRHLDPSIVWTKGLLVQVVDRARD
jgi:hypothetical protein